MRRLAKILLMFSSIIFMVCSCEKDEEPEIENLNGLTNAKFNDDKVYGDLLDIDGNIYKTIQIGNQIWMAENLRTTHYRNGDPIEYIKTNTNWISTNSGAYCNYDNTNENVQIATKGRLYNWYAVSDIRNIAPCGWHVPSDDEWNALISYLGGEDVAGGKLKEIGMLHWDSENVGATNESGFTSLPSGFRDQYYGDFSGYSYNAFYWSSTEDTQTHSWYRYLNNQLTNVGRFSWDIGNKNSGFSIRLIKD